MEKEKEKPTTRINIMIFSVTLFLLFVLLKLTNVIDWSWAIVCSPIIIHLVIILIIVSLTLLFTLLKFIFK